MTIFFNFFRNLIWCFIRFYFFRLSKTWLMHTKSWCIEHWEFWLVKRHILWFIEFSHITLTLILIILSLFFIPKLFFINLFFYYTVFNYICFYSKRIEFLTFIFSWRTLYGFWINKSFWCTESISLLRWKYDIFFYF